VRDLAILFLHLLATLARLAGPGGARSVVAESVFVKQQLLTLNRSRKRSPRLRFSDHMVAGLCALLMRPGRVIRSAIVLKPQKLLGLHRALTTRKYRRLFSSKAPNKPGSKGPTRDVMAAVVDMKRRNPTCGCPRIAHQWQRNLRILDVQDIKTVPYVPLSHPFG
jgi:putative transposase